MIDFVKLLRDDSEEVLESLVPNIGITLEHLCLAGVLSRETVAPGTLEISRALLKCQADIFRYHNWRRKMTFLEQLECLPNVIESDFIHQHFTSVILKLTINAVSSWENLLRIFYICYFSFRGLDLCALKRPGRFWYSCVTT